MTPKYLSHFPLPLLDDLVRMKWLPIIGAGMSRNAIVPSNQRVPLWGELGETLAQEIPDYPYSGAIDAISAYEHEYGRPRLIERLHKLLRIEDAQPGDTHRAFCSIPFDIVCTTNFDFLLEKQYAATPRHFMPAIDEDQLSSSMLDAGTLLLKLHGDLHHPNRLVITEADYDGFLVNLPLMATYLANLLITRTAVLIGYSLDDPDFRQVWHTVSERLGRARRLAYAILVGAPEVDVARFGRRGVRVINLPGRRSNYGSILAGTFNELREYMRDNVLSVSRVTEEEPLRELLLPQDAATRLCLFAIPLDLHPFYRDRVFPVVRECGFVPVTPDSVFSPGDSIAAKTDALIRRASVVVVEFSSSTKVELDMALAAANQHEAEQRLGHRRETPILPRVVVVKGTSELPFDLKHIPSLQRPDTLKEDPEGFLLRLGGLMQSIADELAPRAAEEPRRLLEAREHRAAVISALTLLETTLRRQLSKSERFSERGMPLRRLIEIAEREGLFPAGSLKTLVRGIVVRNEVVHSQAPVSRAQAREIVTGITNIVRRLTGENRTRS